MSEDFLHSLRQYTAIIRKVCRLYTFNREDREDLEQEVMLQLWRSWDSFRDEASRSTWVYRVAMNTAVSFVRKDTRMKRSAGPLPDGETDDGRRLQEEKEELYEMLRRLSDADRMLAMFYLDELSYEEIAGITGWTVNNVGVRMNRMRARLKKIFEDGHTGTL